MVVVPSLCGTLSETPKTGFSQRGSYLTGEKTLTVADSDRLRHLILTPPWHSFQLLEMQKPKIIGDIHIRMHTKGNATVPPALLLELETKGTFSARKNREGVSLCRGKSTIEYSVAASIAKFPLNEAFCHLSCIHNMKLGIVHQNNMSV